MSKSFFRIVAFLLIPSLLMDPIWAAAFSQTSFERQGALHNPEFNRQALLLTALSFAHQRGHPYVSRILAAMGFNRQALEFLQEFHTVRDSLRTGEGLVSGRPLRTLIAEMRMGDRPSYPDENRLDLLDDLNDLLATSDRSLAAYFTRMEASSRNLIFRHWIFDRQAQIETMRANLVELLQARATAIARLQSQLRALNLRPSPGMQDLLFPPARARDEALADLLQVRLNCRVALAALGQNENPEAAVIPLEDIETALSRMTMARSVGSMTAGRGGGRGDGTGHGWGRGRSGGSQISVEFSGDLRERGLRGLREVEHPDSGRRINLADMSARGGGTITIYLGQEPQTWKSKDRDRHDNGPSIAKLPGRWRIRYELAPKIWWKLKREVSQHEKESGVSDSPRLAVHAHEDLDLSAQPYSANRPRSRDSYLSYWSQNWARFRERVSDQWDALWPDSKASWKRLATRPTTSHYYPAHDRRTPDFSEKTKSVVDRLLAATFLILAIFLIGEGLDIPWLKAENYYAVYHSRNHPQVDPKHDLYVQSWAPGAWKNGFYDPGVESDRVEMGPSPVPKLDLRSINDPHYARHFFDVAMNDSFWQENMVRIFFHDDVIYHMREMRISEVRQREEKKDPIEGKDLERLEEYVRLNTPDGATDETNRFTRFQGEITLFPYLRSTEQIRLLSRMEQLSQEVRRVFVPSTGGRAVRSPLSWTVNEIRVERFYHWIKSRTEWAAPRALILTTTAVYCGIVETPAYFRSLAQILYMPLEKTVFVSRHSLEKQRLAKSGFWILLFETLLAAVFLLRTQGLPGNAGDLLQWAIMVVAAHSLAHILFDLVYLGFKGAGLDRLRIGRGDLRRWRLPIWIPEFLAPAFAPAGLGTGAWAPDRRTFEFRLPTVYFAENHALSDSEQPETWNPQVVFNPENPDIQELLDLSATLYLPESDMPLAETITKMEALARRVNPDYRSHGGPQLLSISRRAARRVLEDDLNWQVFLPAGLVVNVIEIADYFVTDVQHLDPDSWTSYDYLGATLREAQLVEELLPHTLEGRPLGVAIGVLALSNPERLQRAAANSLVRILTEDAGSPLVKEYRELLHRRMEQHRLDDMEFESEIATPIRKGEERRHAQAFSYVERHGHPGLRFRHDDLMVMAEEVLRNTSWFRGTLWPAAQSLEEAGAVFEFEGKLGALMDRMDHLMQGTPADTELAYMTFLHFNRILITSSQRRTEALQHTGPDEQGAPYGDNQYRQFGDFFFESVALELRLDASAGQAPDQVQDALRRHLERLPDTPSRAQWLQGLVQRVYAQHFWSHEERQRNLDKFNKDNKIFPPSAPLEQTFFEWAHAAERALASGWLNLLTTVANVLRLSPAGVFHNDRYSYNWHGIITAA